MKCNNKLFLLLGCLLIFLLVGVVSATDENNQTINNINNTTGIDIICQNNSCITPQHTHIKYNHTSDCITPQHTHIKYNHTSSCIT